MNTIKKIASITIFLLLSVAQLDARRARKGYLLDSLKTMMGLAQEQIFSEAPEIPSGLAPELAPTALVQSDQTIAPVVNAPEQGVSSLVTASAPQEGTLGNPLPVDVVPAATPNRINVPVVEQEDVVAIAPAIVTTSYDRQSEEDLKKLGNEGFDEVARRQAVIGLVEKAIAYMSSHTLDDSFQAINHSPAFINGELYLFVYDVQGNCYAHGAENNLIWHNLWNLKDQYNTPIVQNLIKKAQTGGGWSVYFWKGATKVTYTKQVEKDGKIYVIGCGYYPHSKADQAVGLVKGAVAEFNEYVLNKKQTIDSVFSTFSYPIGRFAIGDLYLYILDFQGNIYAQGDRPGLIGANALQYKDAAGKFVNQEIIKKLQNAPQGTGVWVKYLSKNAPKLSYAEKIVDLNGREYFVACGYYPTVTREKAVELTKSAYDYMKRQGKTRALEMFNSKRDDTFRYGDLSVSVLTMDGTLIANGENPDQIGVNLYNAKDEDGYLFVQEVIKKAVSGGGWTSFRVKNSFQTSYSEIIELGLEKYVILVALYPVSKQESALLMLKSAVSYLKTHTLIESMRAFTSGNGTFMRGDLAITAYDAGGICLADGIRHESIWQHMMDAKDDDGKPYVRFIINAVKRGPAKVTYQMAGARRMVFAELVEKDGKNYIISCGYFV